MEQIAEDAVL